MILFELISPVLTPTFSSPEPSPKNDVAVTELIPDMFVALSPTIFPFAFIFKVAFNVFTLIAPTVNSLDDGL